MCARLYIFWEVVNTSSAYDLWHMLRGAAAAGLFHCSMCREFS